MAASVQGEPMKALVRAAALTEPAATVLHAIHEGARAFRDLHESRAATAKIVLRPR